jgi:tetratricopeptide (TPR) repeat protein
VLYGLAQEYAKLGNIAQAVEHFDRCLASDGSYFYAYYHKARALHSGGLRNQAIEAARAGLVAAKAGGDAKARSELQALLDEME